MNAALLLTIAGWLKKIPDVRLLKFLPVCLFGVTVAELLARNATLWFSASPPEICRVLYGFSPFPESPEIARYIDANSKPGETITVLGSEPQIFFLAHRHSASGYVYVYPLTEPQPLAPSSRQPPSMATEPPQYPLPK